MPTSNFIQSKKAVAFKERPSTSLSIQRRKIIGSNEVCHGQVLF
jgi:hypothetical protein